VLARKIRVLKAILGVILGAVLRAIFWTILGAKLQYHTHAIISRGLYIFYPHFSAVYNQDWLISQTIYVLNMEMWAYISKAYNQECTVYIHILGAVFCGNLLGQFFGTMFEGGFFRMMFFGQYFWVIFRTLFKAILHQQSLNWGTFNLIFSLYYCCLLLRVA
jgi:hypothetical protein